MVKRFVPVILLMTLVVLLSAFVGAVQQQAAELPPLTEPGPYDVYHTEMTFVDDHRGDWALKTMIWYPAFTAQGTPVFRGSSLLKNVPPDRSGAPYPLIVYSYGWTSKSVDMERVTAHLASYGYVVAAPQHHDRQPDYAYVDRPLDIVTVIDGLSSLADGDLAGMIDADNVGLMGWSQGGETALQMIGLQYDPAHYESWCAAHPDLPSRDCSDSLYGTSDYRAQLGLQDLPDGRWQPFGDDRIRAVLAIAPGMFPLTTEDMLPEVSTPVMLVHGTADEYCDYEGNSVRAYSGMSLEDRYLVTLVYGAHTVPQSVIQPFATAFFGEYVKGDEDYAAYLTTEQAEKIRDVVWGPYEGQ